MGIYLSRRRVGLANIGMVTGAHPERKRGGGEGGGRDEGGMREG